MTARGTTIAQRIAADLEDLKDHERDNPAEVSASVAAQRSPASVELVTAPVVTPAMVSRRQRWWSCASRWPSAPSGKRLRRLLACRSRTSCAML